MSTLDIIFTSAFGLFALWAVIMLPIKYARERAFDRRYDAYKRRQHVARMKFFETRATKHGRM